MTTQALAVIIEHDAADLDLVNVTGERARAEEAALNALAPATRAAYRADWAAFTAWCRRRAYEPLPAAPAVIAMYLPHAARRSRLRRSRAGSPLSRTTTSKPGTQARWRTRS
jgi:hypothetical protein